MSLIQNQKILTASKFFKYKAVLSFLSGVSIFFISLTIYFLFVDYVESVNQSRATAKNNSFSVDQYIESVFNKIDLSLVSALRESTLLLGTTKKTQAVRLSTLDFYKSKLPEVHAFRVADAQGTVIVNTDRSVDNKVNVEDREYFQYHKSNSNSELYISKPVKSKFDGKIIITVSRRLPSVDRKFVGIIYAAVTIDYFHKFISTIDVGKSGNITLISLPDQVVLYRFPAAENILGQRLKLNPEALNLISKHQISGEWEQVSTVDGKKKTFASRINNSFNYLISTGLAEEDYLQRWRLNFLSRCIVFMVFTLVLILGFIKYVISQEKVELQRNQINENIRRFAISRISNGVAHEINNPLAIIKGKNELAKLLVKSDGSKEDILKMLQDADFMVARAAKIVEALQMLDQKSIEPVGIFSLKDVLDASVAIMAQKISDNLIDISFETVPSIEIKGHKSQLTEAFIHLFSNSVDAIQSSLDKWIKISFQIRNEQVFILFTDSGSGITEKDALQLTDPFFTTKAIGSGVGLGLTVSDSIIRALGGSLTYNAKSKHTQFILKLNIEKCFEVAS